MTAILTASESTALAEHEAVIERGIQTFYEVGMALADIRNRKLYRAGHGTFEEYTEKRWQMSRPRAYELMAAAEVVSGMPDTAQPVTNARQASELARVPEPERVEVWRETVERTEGKPTAAAVRETYEQRKQPTDADLLDGNEWTEPDPEFDNLLDASSLGAPHVRAASEPIPTQVQEQLGRAAKRRPLPEAFADATHDFVRITERLDRLRQDDRFARNRNQIHHQASDFVRALESAAQLAADMDLPAAEASEEARRWWAASLHKISDALRDVANSLEQEQ